MTAGTAVTTLLALISVYRVADLDDVQTKLYWSKQTERYAGHRKFYVSDAPLNPN